MERVRISACTPVPPFTHGKSKPVPLLHPTPIPVSGTYIADWRVAARQKTQVRRNRSCRWLCAASLPRARPSRTAVADPGHTFPYSRTSRPGLEGSWVLGTPRTRSRFPLLPPRAPLLEGEREKASIGRRAAWGVWGGRGRGGSPAGERDWAGRKAGQQLLQRTSSL